MFGNFAHAPAAIRSATDAERKNPAKAGFFPFRAPQAARH
jgi:hypothetical protein